MELFFYPSLVVGAINPSLSDQIQGREYNALNQNVVYSKFGENHIAISSGGLIGIETKNDYNAEKILNTIMATALLLGLPVHSVRTSEIAGLIFDIKTHQMIPASWSETTKRMEMFSRSSGLGTYRTSDIRNRISIKDVKLILRYSESFYNNNELAHSLRLLLGSYTHFANGEFSQSFIMSWTIIEKNLYDLWLEKLLSARVTKRIRDDLDRWDMYRILEILHLDKIISEDEYNDLRVLHHNRNDVIHEGYEVTEKQTEKCYNFASEIITKKTDIKEKIKILERVMF